MYLFLPYYLSCYHKSRDFYLCIHSSVKQKYKLCNTIIFLIELFGERQVRSLVLLSNYFTDNTSLKKCL